MRHYYQMPPSPKESIRKELIIRPMAHAVPRVLREFAELAERLGFESPEITDPKQYPTVPRSQTETLRPVFITDGPGVKKKWRSGLPNTEDYLEDSRFRFTNYLHNRDEEQGESTTSFFVRKSVYFAFFGTPSPLPLEEECPRDEAVRIAQEQAELERQEREKQ